MDQSLLNTGVTGTQIQTWLSDYFQREVKVESCEAKQIAAGQGFTSVILRVFLKYEGDQDSLPQSIVVKTPSMSAVEELVKKLDNTANMEESTSFLTAGHSTECETYRVFGKNPPVPLPRIYAAEHCKGEKMGAIVMEDLCDRSAIIGDPTSVLTLDQLYGATEAVASWHAWCITTDTKWEPHFEAVDSERRKQMYEGWFQMMANCYERVKLKYPNKFDKPDLAAIAKSVFNMEKFSDILQQQREIIPDVIVHGDFYANNLMYETKKDSRGNVTIGSKLVAIIDWPLSHRGCGLEDFGRLLSISVDTKTRREHTSDVLQRYFDALVKKSGKEKVKGSFEEVQKLYNYHFMMAALFFVMMLDWLQNIWVVTTDPTEREAKQQILYERCLDVYEDATPILQQIGNSSG